MLIEMKIKGLALDPLTNVPIVLLRDLEDKQTLPIWIGFFEASAIISVLEKINLPRPMTHDLLKKMLESLGAKVERIIVTELKDNTFYAVIEILQNGALIKLDSRPSDAIALALRVDAPFFVEKEVLKKARKIDLTQKSGQLEKWKEWLEKAKPDDFGKYEM